ncbi:MAG: glycoside hydrolase family 3 N-terminal domain-containing protein [Actinomycetales bacterium]
MSGRKALRSAVALLALLGTVLGGLAIGHAIARRGSGVTDASGSGTGRGAPTSSADDSGEPSADGASTSATPAASAPSSSPVVSPPTTSRPGPTSGSSGTASGPLSASGTGLPAGPGTAHPLYVVDDATARELAQQAFDALTPQQRVGQLFMVGVPVAGASTSELARLQALHVGSYFLHGRSSGGVAQTLRSTRRLTAVTATADDGGRLTLAPFVSADQEGGQVQTLRGPGFSTIPDALTQGQLPAATLRARAARWGSQLAAAGVNLNLAPVADTVPASLGRRNQPIGRYSREYGHQPEAVASSVAAFVHGMTSVGVATSAKHFPGLGRVLGNTDTTAGVTDDQTGKDDAYLAPFRAAVEAGTPLVMMSSAIYSHLDPGTVAAFSPVIIDQLLRGDLGFAGVVVSDDLGAAKAVAAIPAGERATRFFAAGGDLLLTVSATPVEDMVRSTAARAGSDAEFRQQVDDAVRRVLLLKARMGLIRRS